MILEAGDKDVVLRLLSTDDGRRAARAASLRFSARQLRSIGGHEVAALQLEQLAAAQLEAERDWLTDDMIRAHRHEARVVGDAEVARLCNAALGLRTGNSAGVALDPVECRARIRVALAASRGVL